MLGSEPLTRYSAARPVVKITGAMNVAMQESPTVWYEPSAVQTCLPFCSMRRIGISDFTQPISRSAVHEARVTEWVGSGFSKTTIPNCPGTMDFGRLYTLSFRALAAGGHATCKRRMGMRNTTAQTMLYRFFIFYFP